MPLHDDEMNRRREKREAQRKKQQSEAKRLKITLALAAVVEQHAVPVVHAYDCDHGFLPPLKN